MDPPPRPENRPKPYKTQNSEKAPKNTEELPQCTSSSSNQNTGTESAPLGPPRPSNRPKKSAEAINSEKELASSAKFSIESQKAQPSEERPITIQPADPEDPKFTESSGLEAKLKSLDKPGASEDPEAIKLFSETARKLDKEGFGGPTSRSLHYPGLGPGPQIAQSFNIPADPASSVSLGHTKRDDEPTHHKVEAARSETTDTVPPPRPAKRPQNIRSENVLHPQGEPAVFDLATEIASCSGEKEAIQEEFSEGLDAESRAEIEHAELIERNRRNAEELGEFAPKDEVEEREQKVHREIEDLKPINENLETETITEEPEEERVAAKSGITEPEALIKPAKSDTFNQTPDAKLEAEKHTEDIEPSGANFAAKNSESEDSRQEIALRTKTAGTQKNEYESGKDKTGENETVNDEVAKDQPLVVHRGQDEDTNKDLTPTGRTGAPLKETEQGPIERKLQDPLQRRSSDIDPKDSTHLKLERRVLPPKPKSVMAQRFEAALLEQTNQKPKPILKPKPRLSTTGSAGGPPASSAFGARFADLNAALSRPPPVHRSSVASTSSSCSLDEETEPKESKDLAANVAEQSVDENETADAQLKAMPTNPRARARGPGGKRRLPSTVQPILAVFVSKTPVWEIAAEKSTSSFFKPTGQSVDNDSSGLSNSSLVNAEKQTLDAEPTSSAVPPPIESNASDNNNLEKEATIAATSLLLDEGSDKVETDALPKDTSDQGIPFPVKQTTREMTPDREDAQRYNFFSDTDEKSEGLSDTDALTMFAPPRRGSEQIGVAPTASYVAERPPKTLETLDERDSEKEPRLMGVNTELDLKSAVRRAIDSTQARGTGPGFSNDLEDELRSDAAVKSKIPMLSSLLDKDPDSTMDFDDDLAPPITRTRMSFEDLLAQTAPVTTSTTPTLGVSLSRYLDQGPQSTGFDLEIEGEPEEYFSIPVKRSS